MFENPFLALILVEFNSAISLTGCSTISNHKHACMFEYILQIVNFLSKLYLKSEDSIYQSILAID